MEKKLTVREATDEYVKYLKKSKGEKTVATAQVTLDLLAGYFRALQMIQDLQACHVSRFTASAQFFMSRYSRIPKPFTMAARKRALRNFLDYCELRGHTAGNIYPRPGNSMQEARNPPGYLNKKPGRKKN